ncbi:glycosyltransferase family 4 protein [Brevundimonas sp.]|uniref:glycosyltransferase family 4 protein n=1 Tax=Brevundimonas sp. TaxID=1871086 RepID=UPI0028AA5921|nr:glycosyltransferase family 4 protein [Brevundimonas sp.]
MKVAVINGQVPFVWGGAEEMAANVVKEMRRRAIDADLVRIPMRWEPPARLATEMQISQMLDLDHYDIVVGSKFPNYGIQHRNMRIWLVHQYRQAYDLWDAGQSNIPNDDAGVALRDQIRRFDAEAFARAKQIACIARPVSERLSTYMGIDAPINPLPVNDEHLFSDSGSEGYIFAGGRVNGAKRQAMIIDAMAHVRSNVKLIVAGPPENEADAVALMRKVERHDLKDRVKLDFGFLPRETIASYVNNALACVYIPFLEDSYGYVTVEAYLSSKPVITTTDSGGVLEIVKHGVTGHVVHPDPESLAHSFDEMFANAQTARDLGAAGRAAWRSLGFNWDNSIAAILGS